MSEQIAEMAAGQGIFALLFVVLLFYQMRSSEKREDRILLDKKELQEDSKHREKVSIAREEKLMNHHDQTNISLKEITDANNKIVESVGKMEKNMHEGFGKVWERLDKIKE